MDEICLVIKAPNQKYEDLKINCELSWTILDLKMYLFNEYPSKPIISDQRLIYSGHLLKDEQSLRDIIQSPGDSNTYTFHLVCPQKQTNKSDQPNSASEATSSTRELPPEAMNAFQSFSPNLTNPSSGNPLLNHFGSSNNAVMQESYNTMMNQYYQYMSYYYLSSPPITDFASYYAFANAYMRGVNANNLASPTLNLSNENVNNANGNENQPNAAANNRNANNQNNNQADNEEGNRDWTELLYSFSKAMVMLSIMYFYSSFGRLLLLITIALVLYLYKNARLVGVQNILNNNNNEQDNVREQPQMEQANNEANNNENPQSEQQDLPDEGDNNSSNGTRENLRYSGLRLVWVFVSSLFTSLIPDPTPIN